MAILPSNGLSVTDTNNTTFPTTAGGSTSIAEGMAPSGVNNALRSIASMLAAMWGGMYSGTSRDANVQAGSLWRDTSGGATANVIYYYDGTDDIAVVTVNTTANTVTFKGSIQPGGSGATVTTILDEDDMATDSATALATQQSIKAYADSFPGSPLTTRGDLIYRGASVAARLAVGTAGQYLRSDGTDPAWYTPISWGTPIDLTNSGANDTGQWTWTSIPADAVEIFIALRGASLSGTDVLGVTIGDSGGLETTGYTSDANNFNTYSQGQSTTYYRLLSSSLGSFSINGLIRLVKYESGVDGWDITSFLHASGGTNSFAATGYKELSGTLDRVSLLASGTDNFDAGEANIGWRRA